MEALFIDTEVTVRVHTVLQRQRSICLIIDIEMSIKTLEVHIGKEEYFSKVATNITYQHSRQLQNCCSPQAPGCDPEKAPTTPKTLLPQVRDPKLYRWPIQLELLSPAHIAEQLCVFLKLFQCCSRQPCCFSGSSTLLHPCLYGDAAAATIYRLNLCVLTRVAGVST